MQTEEKLQEKESRGGWFLPTPQGGKARGKWWGVNFRQTLCALFVFSPTPWKTRVCHPFWPDNNICKQLLAYEEKKKRGEKKHNAITPLPIKTELNKSSSSNHSHMNTCVAVISYQRHFCPTCTDIISNHGAVCLIEWMLSFLCSASELIVRRVFVCTCEFLPLITGATHSVSSAENWNRSAIKENFLVFETVITSF